MSSPAPVLVSGVASLVTTTTQLPAGSAPQASVNVTVTDSANTVYPVVSLNGSETPPWSYAATFASGAASAVAVAMDTSGNQIGTPATLAFTVTPVVPQTFQAPSGFAFMAASASAAAAAVHRNATVKT